mgnify:CR=1 FL=1
MEIIKIQLRLSNAYLLRGDRPVLMDTGSPGDAGRIINALQAAGVAPEDLALIVLTHGHGDHAGSARELRARSGAPVAIHPADGDLVRSGKKALLSPTRLTGRIMAPFVNLSFPALEPDLLFEAGTTLAPWGVDGQVLHTPGHTGGSISLRLSDRQMIIGDLLMGGLMGGTFRPSRPGIHYFAEDQPAIFSSISRILEMNPQTFYVGHGGPLSASAVRIWLKNQPLPNTLQIA